MLREDSYLFVGVPFSNSDFDFTTRYLKYAPEKVLDGLICQPISGWSFDT
jgi:hypothetical protein